MTTAETGMHHYRLIGIIIMVALLLIIVLQNMDPIETHILFFSFTLPRAMLLVIAALIGFLIGLLLSWRRFR